MTDRRGLAGPPPELVKGPHGPWDRVDAALQSEGYALAYGYLGDWRGEDVGDDELNELLGVESQRYSGLSTEDQRSRFAASRLLLKHVAAAVLGADPKHLELARNPNGRPYLRGIGQLDVSLSHTNDILAVGLSHLGPIGVDVEAATRKAYGTGLERDVCTAHERASLAWIPEEERNAAVIRLWTLKEAYSKALGLGLRMPFKSFGFTTPPTATAAAMLLRVDGGPADAAGWQFETHRLDDGHTISAAVGPTAFGAADHPKAGEMLDAGIMSELLNSYSAEGFESR